jgi:prephenate dehydrogenase
VTTSPTEDARPRGGPTDRTVPLLARRAMIFGTGLIGGSVGMALRDRRWHVSGVDDAPGVAARAVELGALSVEGVDRQADLVVVATPVRAAASVIGEVLSGDGWGPHVVVTDVGSVKGPLVAAVDHPRFVGGHPMAGSEQVGVEGATGDLFVGATWVLTPTATTDPDAFALVRNVLADLGAQVMALDPAQHDALVAVVSHVPHLTAATLMVLAAGLGEEHAALLQLAAGGFRDMTRIAAGQPTIWPDICDDNAEAIVATLDLLIEALGRSWGGRPTPGGCSATGPRCPRGWSRCGSPCWTAPAPSPRSRCWPPSWASTSWTWRSPTRSTATGACW